MNLTDIGSACSRGLGRLGRHAAAVFRPRTGHVVYHPSYRADEGSIVDSRRAQHILSYLLRQGCISLPHLRRPSPATLHQLQRVHSTAYLESLDDPRTHRRIFGRDFADRIGASVVAQQRTMVGGTIAAAVRAIAPSNRGRPVVNLGGGFHHADRDSGHGFCIFNDVAVAIAQLRREGFSGRVLVVDLDLHHGDGTRRMFAGDQTVFTYSVHANDWEYHPAVADMSIPLGAGIGDAAYLDAIARTLPEAFRAARPDLVFYVAGVDVAREDLLGSWLVTPDGILARDQMVVDYVSGRPLVWLLSGGYGGEAWRHSARSLGWLFSGLTEPIPSRDDHDLRRFRRVARRLSEWELAGPPPDSQRTNTDQQFALRESDVMGDLSERSGSTRFLGLYSPYGVECALDRYGVLPHLRRLGFRNFRVDFELKHATGERVRLYDQPNGASLLLMELVAREDTSQHPYRLLALEWLLLQNPLARPSADRPLLPGQEHPGLGCLREIGLVLVMACERLGLDGLAFTPTHYHLAVQAKGRMFFVNPALQGRFLAMQSHLEGIPLAPASRLAADGSLRDAFSGRPFRWRTGPMVLPVSEAMTAHFSSPEYIDAVGSAAAGLRIAQGTSLADPDIRAADAALHELAEGRI